MFINLLPDQEEDFLKNTKDTQISGTSSRGA